MTPDRAKFNKEVEKGLLDRGVNVDIRPMTKQEYLEQRVKMLETLLKHREDQITGLKAHAEALNSECLERELQEANKFRAFVEWFDLYGVSINTVADERGSYCLDWYRGEAFGNSMRELMLAVDFALGHAE